LLRVGVSALCFEQVEQIVTEPLSEDGQFGALLGCSVAMRRIFALLPRIAASDATVLLEGETGTGKGLLADTIHQASRRSDGPFQLLDCGVIPPTLIESELFGHERGAFTGAHAARAGIFEAAHGGTVFLDEIGELPLELQPKLLRVLEERMVRRVGATQQRQLDFRLIAATNVDLRGAVNRGVFRSDLYFRLNVIALRVPSLRERREDVPLLIAHFYDQFTGGSGSEPPAEWVAELSGHDWPGNVRELRAAVERTVLLGDPGMWRSLQVGDPEAIDAEPELSFRAAKERAVAQWEASYLHSLYERCDRNLSLAARNARMDRTHLRELLRRRGVLK
jgi:transcriptional regulator with PAS, ATPase and Fis domain